MKPITSLSTVKKAKDKRSYISKVLDCFDALTPESERRQQVGKPQRLDTDPEVRRKAKSAL